MANNAGEHAEPRDHRKHSGLDADLLKLASTSVLATFFFAGFSFTNSYFRTFGLGIFDLRLDFIDIVSRGLFLLQDWRFFLLITSLALLGTFVLRLNFIQLTQERIYLALGVIFIITVWAAGSVGVWIGQEYSRGVTMGKYGKVAYCSLSSDNKLGDDFSESFRKLTLESRLRKVLETDEMLYLSATLDNVPEGYNGASFAIPKTDIAFCRYIGD